MLNESLTEFENVQSTPGETAIKNINKRCCLSTTFRRPMSTLFLTADNDESTSMADLAETWNDPCFSAADDAAA